jgi:hypothetical protein
MTRDSEACRRPSAPSDPSRLWSLEQVAGVEKNHRNSRARDRVDGAGPVLLGHRSFHRSPRPDLTRPALSEPFPCGGRRSRRSRRRRLERCAGSSANRQRAPQGRLLRSEMTAASQTRPSLTHGTRCCWTSSNDRSIAARGENARHAAYAAFRANARKKSRVRTATEPREDLWRALANEGFSELEADRPTLAGPRGRRPAERGKIRGGDKERRAALDVRALKPHDYIRLLLSPLGGEGPGVRGLGGGRLCNRCQMRSVKMKPRKTRPVLRGLIPRKKLATKELGWAEPQPRKNNHESHELHECLVFVHS